MPNTGSPKRISPISVPQAGMPAMKDLVPSIGSSIQTYSASVRSPGYSSPRMPWSGKLRRISVRMASSAARSAAVTGSKPARLLVLDRQRGAEERQDGLARNRGELVDKGREIDCRHGFVLGLCRPSEELTGRQLRRRRCGIRGSFGRYYISRPRYFRMGRGKGPNPEWSYAQITWDSWQTVLRFVRRGVNYCNAVAIPLPSLGVSSLDLGRLHPRAALFLSCR